jgi:hypothetical protein
VIGVLKKQGAALFGESDTSAFIPLTIRQLYGDSNTSLTNVDYFQTVKGLTWGA